MNEKQPTATIIADGLGEPAFPSGERWTRTDLAGNSTDNARAPFYRGMSLRDWFAGQALAGLCAATDRDGPHELYGQDAYAFADAMLKAREEAE